MSKLTQLRRLIRESILSLLKEEDVKIYLQKGEKPPKGKKVQKGPRGGQYFTGSAQEKQAFNDAPTSPKVAKDRLDKVRALGQKSEDDAFAAQAKPRVNIFNKSSTKKPKEKSNISADVIKNSLPTDEYMDMIIDIERDTMGDGEDSLAKDYTDLKNYINKSWPGAKMLSTEDDGGEDVGDIIDDLDGNNKQVSEKKFGDNLEVTDYGEAAVFRYNDIGGSMNTLIIKPKGAEK